MDMAIIFMLMVAAVRQAEGGPAWNNGTVRVGDVVCAVDGMVVGPATSARRCPSSPSIFCSRSAGHAQAGMSEGIWF
jgi:hypothetical protein